MQLAGTDQLFGLDRMASLRINITKESGSCARPGAVMTGKCRKAYRCLVDSLPNISEESFAEEVLYTIPVQSAWEQVVKGWNEPLVGIIELQNNGKLAVCGEKKFHRLLCIGANLSQKPKEDLSESSETNRSLEEDPKGENCPFSSINGTTPPNVPAEISCSEAALGDFKHQKTPTIQTQSCPVPGRAELLRLPDNVPSLPYIRLAVPCLLTKERVDRFTVSPPAGGFGYLRRCKLWNCSGLLIQRIHPQGQRYLSSVYQRERVLMESTSQQVLIRRLVHTRTAPDR